VPLFLQGDYLPLETKGPNGKHVVAFARRLEESWAVVAAGRFFTGMLRAGELSWGAEVWKQQVLALPQEAPTDWVNLFTGEKLASPQQQRSRSLPLDRLFRHLPVALLQGRVG
jgi:(1->4)-alpha-D-glucan 1-alpha-D-glucosylmutase